MKKTSLEDVKDALENERYTIEVDPIIRQKAYRALKKNDFIVDSR